MVFNATDDEGNSVKYIFDIYRYADFPIEGGGIYIFGNTYYNTRDPEYFHINCTPSFSSTFTKGNLKRLLKKYQSNSILICECDDIEAMENIVNRVEKSDAFDNFYRADF